MFLITLQQREGFNNIISETTRHANVSFNSNIESISMSVVDSICMERWSSRYLKTFHTWSLVAGVHNTVEHWSKSLTWLCCFPKTK